MLSPNNVKKTKQDNKKQSTKTAQLHGTKKKGNKKISLGIFYFLYYIFTFSGLLVYGCCTCISTYKYVGALVCMCYPVCVCVYGCGYVCARAHVWRYAFLSCLEGFGTISTLTSHNLSSGCRWRTWAGTPEQRESIIAFSLPAPSRKLTFNFLCDYPAYYQTGWWPASL